MPFWTVHQAPQSPTEFALEFNHYPGASGATYLVRLGDQSLTSARWFHQAVAGFGRELHFLLAQSSSHFAFIHAGVVAWKGQAVVFPGSSFFGKSTLIAALLSRGASYLSDEFAVIELTSGRIHPFPRPISLRQSGSLTSKVTRLPSDWCRLGVSLGAVVDLTYQPGAKFRLQDSSPGRTALLLLGHAVAAQRFGAVFLPSLGRACQKSVNLCGVRGEAVEAADHLVALLDSRLLAQPNQEVGAQKSEEPNCLDPGM